ncbi:FAD-dependent oxidoreductase [Limnohabitans sp.]|uniref:FAD-dependent oxidoreductase n=1 Tax=Limnohabitans sp. TaxID=1907725 RepID=UPI00311F38A4
MQVLKNGIQGLNESAYDLVVVGAGGAGMATALFAAMEGASVLLVERTEYVGGTTAWSAGTSWIPGSQHAAKVNPNDTQAETARYLDNAVGERTSKVVRQAFLDNGRAAVDEVEARSELKYRPYPKHPDYISDLGGSTLSGRALEPMPFDARLLGRELFALLRPPIPEFTVIGGMMVDRTDINHLLAMTKNWASLKHSVKIVMRHAMDRLSWPRGTRLVMGNAHVARLLHSLSKFDKVTIALNSTVEHIVRGPQGVERVDIACNGERRSVRVNKGMVLASGGFNRHPELRAQMLPGVPAEWSPAAPGHTGQAHDLAKQLGAVYGQGGLSHAFWAPVSLRKRADGSTAAFPHFVMDRAKPGMITVNARGERFLNESTSYHLFGLAMQEANKTRPSIPAYLVCDADALRKYGIGMVRPGGKGLAPFLADGYLTEGATLAELASKLGMDAQALQASVAQNNRNAETGVDPDFHRGETAYQQNLGDPAWTGKNPNIGPLAQGPFYAVRLYPGDIGSSTGFATNEHAQVLGADGQAIGGLYAVGNDMHSIMGGTYPAPGITIGPGLVFGRIAARHALGLP